MSREDMNNHAGRLPSYEELIKLVELAENIEERLDNGWRRFVILLSGMLVGLTVFTYSIILFLSRAPSSSSSLLYLQLGTGSVILFLLLLILAPRGARRYVSEARAYAEATDLLREVYSLLSYDALSVVQRAEVEVRMSRLKLPGKTHSGLFVIFPGLRREFDRAGEIARDRSGEVWKEHRLERHLIDQLRSFYGLENVLSNPTTNGVTVDAVVRDEAAGCIIDLLYFRSTGLILQRLVRSQERLARFKNSFEDDTLKAVTVCVVYDGVKSEELRIMRRLRDAQQEARESMVRESMDRSKSMYWGERFAITVFSESLFFSIPAERFAKELELARKRA
jgi:hypothetical protein